MILIADQTDVLADDGVEFQAYITTRPIPPSGGLTPLGFVREGHLIAWPSPSSVQLSVTPDFGGGPVTTSTVSLAAAGSETRVIPQFQDIKGADLTVAQLTLGDAAATSSAWSLDMVVLPSYEAGER